MLQMLGALQLVSDPMQYQYLAKSGCTKVDNMNDTSEFRAVRPLLSSRFFL